MKTFDKIRQEINSSEVVDNNTIYLIESSIADRKLMIINDLEVVNGRLNYEPHLKNGSKWMNQMILEIKSLEKAKVTVQEMMRGENDEK